MTNSPTSTKTTIIRRPSFRHVSIVDDSSSNANTPTGPPPATAPQPTASQQSISNSPHSSQRRNSITPGTPPSSNQAQSNNNSHHHQRHHHSHHHHPHNQHHRKMSQDSKCSNILGGSLSGGLIEGCSKPQLKTQNQTNSRRHSDGTVTLHGRKDGHCYSIHSDRNSIVNCSNVGSGSSTSSISSLKSNRSNFSGVSYSTRSNRRKLSVNSTAQTGKIPWCGCWGNGCL